MQLYHFGMYTFITKSFIISVQRSLKSALNSLQRLTRFSEQYITDNDVIHIELLPLFFMGHSHLLFSKSKIGRKGGSLSLF